MNEFNEWVLKETGTYISSSSGPWRLAQNAWEFQAEKIRELEKKLAIAVKALEFYGEVNNWMSLIEGQYNVGKIWVEVDNLFGQITTENGAHAREALKRLAENR